MTRPISECRAHLAAILTYASDRSPHPKAWPADDADLALHDALDELEAAREQIRVLREALRNLLALECSGPRQDCGDEIHAAAFSALSTPTDGSAG